MNLSEKILYCRKKAGLSQEALAEKLGLIVTRGSDFHGDDIKRKKRQ